MKISKKLIAGYVVIALTVRSLSLGRYRHVALVLLLGLVLTVVLFAIAQGQEQARTQAQFEWGVLAGGLLITALLVTYLISLINNAAKTQRMAAELTTVNEDLKTEMIERERAEKMLYQSAHLASIGELTAGVAHEINNPLTAVLGYAQLVIAQEVPGQIKEDIERIYSEAERAVKIIQNLLVFSRQHEPEKQYTDMTTILERSLELTQHEFKMNNIKTTVEWPQDLPSAMVDEHQLTQVFLNILTNAGQAIHKENGGGQIGVCATISGNEIGITIKDDGPGIPREILPKIFDPFFTTKKFGQGTGLGLSISYGIVKQHGGDIWAESEPGEGTTFYINIPVIAPE